MDCGGCVFMLFWTDTDPYGYCMFNPKEESRSVKATDICKNWIDVRVRYASQLKEITDKNTLNWASKVINQAYLDRLFLEKKEE